MIIFIIGRLPEEILGAFLFLKIGAFISDKVKTNCYDDCWCYLMT